MADFTHKIANRITKLGLITPAIFLLEAHKPFAFIGSQLVLVAQPTLDLFFSPDLTRNLADLLGDSGRLEQLITELETRVEGG